MTLTSLTVATGVASADTIEVRLVAKPAKVTIGIPAGGGAMFELTLDEAGSYPFVTHSFRWAGAGALGLIEAK